MASSSNGKEVKAEPKKENDEKPEFWFDPELVYSLDMLYQEELRAKLFVGPTKKEIVSPLAPHIDTMHDLGIFQKINSVFNKAGLPYWSSIMSCPTYNKLVVEFVATFYHGAGKDYSCGSWIYSINNTLIVTKAKPIREFLFGSKDKIGDVPRCTEEERILVWKKLTDMEVYSPNCSPRCIRKGWWMYIHQLIATHINPRIDGASRVTIEDLDILYYMYMGYPIDWFRVITERFRRMGSPKDREMPLGCTSFITRLAQFEGWNFRCRNDGFHELDMRTLEAYELYDSRKKEWIYKPSLRG